MEESMNKKLSILFAVSIGWHAFSSASLALREGARLAGIGFSAGALINSGQLLFDKKGDKENIKKHLVGASSCLLANYACLCVLHKGSLLGSLLTGSGIAGIGFGAYQYYKGSDKAAEAIKRNFYDCTAVVKRGTQDIAGAFCGMANYMASSCKDGIKNHITNRQKRFEQEHPLAMEVWRETGRTIERKKTEFKSSMSDSLKNLDISEAV